MKKIAISLGIIGVVAAIVIGATTAYFSDTETSTGNTFTAGVIDISLDPSDGQVVKTVSGGLDLKPCQTGYTYSVVTNEGPNPAEIWKHIGNVVNEENGIVEPEQEYYEKYPNSVNKKLSNWIHYDMSIAKPFYATRNMEMIWGSGLSELEGELMVEVSYGCEKTLFKATAPSDYGGNGMMTFTFDMARDGVADFQIQWQPGVGWQYSEVDEAAGKWDKDPNECCWVGVPGKYVTSKSGRVYTLEVPTEDLGKKYKLGVDSNDQADENGQIFFSIDPEHIWWNGTDYISSDWYVLMNVFETVIDEEEGYMLTGGECGVESHWMYLGELGPKGFMCVRQSYHLDKDVDNWGQSDMVSFDMDFMALQEGAEGEPEPILGICPR